MLPVHFSPWQTVDRWFRRFVRSLLFRTIHDVALMIDRGRVGREVRPTAAVIDSQTIKVPMVEVVRHSGTKPGCEVKPRRWAVERSSGWLPRYRRFVRDCERRLAVSEATIFLAMGNLRVRGISHP